MGIRARQDGFSLVEASVATALVAGALMMAARWVVDGAQAGSQSARASVAVVLAADKLERLRALRYAVDDAGVRRADLASDTATDPPSPTGGLGLSPAPEGTLDADIPGYVDYIASDGRTIATRAGAAYVRRWAIRPLTLVQDDGVIVEVCVLPIHAALSGGARDARHQLDAVCVTSLRTRGAR